MNCFSRDELRGYLLQELAADAQAPIEQHVSSCAACCQTLDLLATDDLVRDYFEASQRDSCNNGETASIAANSTKLAGHEMPEWQPFTTDATQLPLRFGRFVLKETLGSGGFGVVYRADDVNLEREVAIKIPHLGGLSPAVRQRFLQEGTAAANLHHPHIVQVHQSGTHRGVCFLVSEYCPGRTLKDLMNESGGIESARHAARIVLPLVEAMVHAHQNGVVHRDIKPANVILDARTKLDGLPFCPKLTDFGAARVAGTDQSITESGMLIGTAPYMAPEQIAGSEVGTACDVYALGVLLYELTAGQLPIQGTDSADTVHKVISLEPVPLNRLLPEVSRDFSAICSCCLEKNPAKRYASAAHLADDLRRFLNHEPTAARPLGPAARLFRWSRRNPLPMTVMGAVCLVFGLISLQFVWHKSRLQEVNQQLSESNRWALTMKDRAEQSELRTRRLLYVSTIRLAAKLWREGDLRSVSDTLSRLEPRDDQLDLRGVEWYFLERATRQGVHTLATYGGPLYFIRLSPDAKRFATAGQAGVIRLHDRATGELRQSIASGQGEVNSVAFSPDGETLASAGDDGSIRLWRTADGTQLDHIAAHDGLTFGVEFTPDSKYLISCGSDNAVHVWENGKRKTSYRIHTSRVEAIAVSPDGRWLASVSKDRSLAVHDLQSGELHFHWKQALGTLSSVTFSPDSRQIAAVEASGETKWLRLFDVASGQLMLQRKHMDGIRSVSFAPDGDRVLTTDNEGTARAWDVSDQSKLTDDKPLAIWHAHGTRAYSGAFEPGGISVLTAGQDGRVCRLRMNDMSDCVVDRRELQATSNRRTEDDLNLTSITFHPNDRDILAASAAGIWTIDSDGDAAPELLAMGRFTHWQRIAKPRYGTWFAFAGSTPDAINASGQHSPATLWRYETTASDSRELLRTPSNGAITDIACSPAGDMLAVVVAPYGPDDTPKQLLLLDAAAGKLLREFPAAMGTKPRFCRDGSALVYGVQRDLHYVDLQSNTVRVIRNAHADSQAGLAVSEDGKWIATCSDNRDLRLWNLATLQQHALLQGHRGKISAMHFSADSRTLFSSSFDGTVKAWSVSEGQHLLDLHLGTEGLDDMALSKDGNRLAIVEGKRRVHIYHLFR